jgi:hypothetical protein
MCENFHKKVIPLPNTYNPIVRLLQSACSCATNTNIPFFQTIQYNPRRSNTTTLRNIPNLTSTNHHAFR